ncbi:MAG: ATP-binding protein [Fimbriimonadaceae bacterium]
MDHLESEIAYVLLLDIVAYSLLSLESQARVTASFRRIVREGCDEVRPPHRHGPLALDRGDGVALVFFGGPAWAVDCTIALVGELRRADIEVRAGLHLGPIVRVQDVNDQLTVAGPAINLAERVMSCADGGQLLFSAAASEMAIEQSTWGPFLEDLGEHEVKHGVKVRLLNFVNDSCGTAGMPNRLALAARSPQKRRLDNFTEPERPFVGRRTELENLRHRIEEDRVRLLTVIGPGGIGKTRLALQAAKQLVPNFADGAWLIECDVLTGSEDLVAQVSVALGVEPGDNALHSLTAFLADKQMLLVMDSFERIVSHARVLEHLLRHAPEVQVIATSRTLLGLQRESEYVLGPLSLHREAGATADAISLFLSAAHAVLPDLRITRRNQGAIEAIVTAVEGVPLAIVLAAGRLRHMSLIQLAEQLSVRPLEVLRRKPIGNDRHANLGRVVDDSFALLGADLRNLLVNLSVFRGGFRVADAEAVFGATVDVLSGISELRDNSLLSASVIDDEMRFRSLDVIADYIEGIADPLRIEPVRRSHAAYYAHRAGELRTLYDDGQWAAVGRRLGSELGNYRRAIEYSIAFADAALVKQLGASLCRLFMEAGYRADFERLAVESLRLAQDSGDLPVLIEMTGLLGGVHRRDRDFEAAEREWLNRASYCRQRGDVEAEADTFLDLADMESTRGEVQKADAHLARFALLEPHLGRGLVLASGYVARAKSEARRGNTAAATQLAAQAQALAQGLPQRTHSFYIWTALTDVYNELCLPGLSEQLIAQGIPDSIAGKHFSYTGAFLCTLAASLEVQGQIALAANAIAIAHMIPKSVALTLRSRVVSQREQFVKKHGSAELRECEKLAKGAQWQLLALELVHGLGHAVPIGRLSEV